MPSLIIRKLRTMNTWYLIGLSVIASETITALLSIALTLIGWEKISFDSLLVGAVDVFVATAIVALLLIRLIKQTATLEELNAGFAFEIAERKRMSDALEQQRAFLRQVIDTDPNFIFVRDRAGYYWLANKAFADMLGVSSAEIVGKALSDFWGDPAKAARFNQEDIAVMDSLKELYIPEEQIEIGGQIRWFRFVKRPIVNRDGVANQVLCVFADITERKQIEQALRVSEERWRMYIEQANDLIFALDGSGKITLANRALCRTLGYSVDEIIGASPLDFAAPAKRDMASAALARILSGGDIEQMEMDALTKDGRLITIEVRGRILLEQGQVTGTFHIARDITERKRIEEQLRYLGTHDVLTGLYNRAYFEAEMKRLAHGRQFPVSIVMVDVNNLKGTNDRHGHAAGDELLRRAARVLQDAFRVEDIVARIGGDEFAVLLPGVDQAPAREGLARVRHLLAERNADWTDLPLGLALGVATGDAKDNLNAVLTEADRRMYQAKRE